MNIGKHWLPATLLILSGTVLAAEQLSYRAPAPIEVTARTPAIHLDAVGSPAAIPDPSLGWTLKLSGIWVVGQPSGGYGLYLNLAPDSQPTPQDANYVGALSAYDLPRHFNSQRPLNLSYDLQPAFARLRADGRLNALSNLAIVPNKQPGTATTLHIQAVEIYRKRP